MMLDEEIKDLVVDDTKTYFTSDLHFCHDKEFIYKPRGFNNIYEHNQAIVDNWNKTVRPNDDVYVLGDMMLNNNEEGLRLIKNLKGRIHIILGNHDSKARIDLYKGCYNVVEVVYSTMFMYKHKNFYLSHYPVRLGTFEERPNLVCLHGHTHDTDKFQYILDCNYNVSLDAHNMSPVLIDNIIEDIKVYRKNI